MNKQQSHSELRLRPLRNVTTAVVQITSARNLIANLAASFKKNTKNEKNPETDFKKSA